MRKLIPLLILIAAGNRCQVSTGGEVSRPNIVIFLVDDMGLLDTSVPFLTDGNGSPKRYPLNDYYRTPNMERLASQGIRFNNFYAMSVCSPTRVSLLTGQNAARHRTTNWINAKNNNAGPNGPPNWNWRGLKKSDVTLARILQSNGYRTIHIGKGHFGPDDTQGSDPLNLGFDRNIGGASFGSPASYYGKNNFARDGRLGVPHLEKYHGKNIFLTQALTEEAMAQVSECVAEGTPFFLYLSHYAAHAPFQSDKRYASNYRETGKPKNAQAFATLIEGMDDSLGDLLDHLDRLGVAEDTLILFLGDNGSDAPLGGAHEVASAAPLRGKKGSHYEGGMRVPFIAAWAKVDPANELQKSLKIPPGSIQPQLATVCDVFPTVLELVDVEAPARHAVDGFSLVPLLEGQPDSARSKSFLMHYPHSPHRSSYFTVYRDGDWKVVYHYFHDEANNQHRYQLFDLASDPFEEQNLADTKQEVLARMMRGMIRELEHHAALYPISDQGVPVKPELP